MKSCKKNASVLSNDGFTMLDMLLTFSVFCTIVSFFPFIVGFMDVESFADGRVQRLEWEVFVSQIKKEIRMSTSLTVSGQSIVMEKEGKVILYEKYGTNIRRRVDFKGHEIILQNVPSVQFENIPNGVRVMATDRFGRNYLEEIHVFVGKGVP